MKKLLTVIVVLAFASANIVLANPFKDLSNQLKRLGDGNQ